MKTKKSVLKAVVPFMLLGTPALAGSSIRLGSKFRTKKTVIQSQSISTEHIKKESSIQNPFGIFGETIEPISKGINEPQNVMDFLEEEGLLVPTTKESSIISGDQNLNGFNNRKSFLDTTIMCVAGAVDSRYGYGLIKIRSHINTSYSGSATYFTLFYSSIITPNYYASNARFENARIVCSPPPVPPAPPVVVNIPPSVKNLVLTGTLEEGSSLTGTYSYSDVEDDVEDGTIFNWYRSDDSSGTGRTTIANATSSIYVLTRDDVGKFISFGVIPVNAKGRGSAVQSLINSTAVRKRENDIMVQSIENGEETNSTVSLDSNLNDVNIVNNEATVNIGEKRLYINIQNNGDTNASITLSDGRIASLRVEGRESQTTVEKDGRIRTIAQIDDTTIETNLNLDGTLGHRVIYKGAITEVNSSIVGATMSIDGNGSIETISEFEKNGFKYKAIVQTNRQGKTNTKFIWTNVATGEAEELSNTLKAGTSFESGNNLELLQLSDLIYIKVTTALNNGILVIE